MRLLHESHVTSADHFHQKQVSPRKEQTKLDFRLEMKGSFAKHDKFISTVSRISTDIVPQTRPARHASVRSRVSAHFPRGNDR